MEYIERFKAIHLIGFLGLKHFLFIKLLHKGILIQVHKADKKSLDVLIRYGIFIYAGTYVGTVGL